LNCVYLPVLMLNDKLNGINGEVVGKDGNGRESVGYGGKNGDFEGGEPGRPGGFLNGTNGRFGGFCAQKLA